MEIGEIEVHRARILGHCYRMLGSAQDASDAAQETLIRAWKSVGQFEGRSSLSTWLYRIATHVCLDIVAERDKRSLPADLTTPGSIDGELDPRAETCWIEPIPDAWVLPENADPAEKLLLRESIRLAFVAAMQYLPPKQRAALLLTEVVAMSAAEVADTLDTSIASVNSALQRARATLAQRGSPREPAELTAKQRELVEAYALALERFDVDALVKMLAADVVYCMPPMALWLQGQETVRAWLHGPKGGGCRGSRYVPVSACGMPAFAQYREGGRLPWSLILLEIRGERVGGVYSFLDVPTLFRQFNLPESVA